MPRNTIPDHAPGGRPKTIAWHQQIRFTILGATIGLLAALSVLLVCFNNIGGGAPLAYLCPVTFRLIRMAGPAPAVLVLFALVFGGFAEWVVWGLLTDLCRLLISKGEG